MEMHREGQSIEEIVATAHKDERVKAASASDDQIFDEMADEILGEIKGERTKTAPISDDKNDEVGKDGKDGKDGRSMKPLKEKTTPSGRKKVRVKAKKTTASIPAPSSSPSLPPKVRARKRMDSPSEYIKWPATNCVETNKPFRLRHQSL
ncbi:hypothetical protein CMUS01_06522 [Colletotrichum musicola]|uniref:Uncharacterized protein n=1 Tax=Colletotrichum musicola TaxID=2175873 RepID=A0A8H6NI73_9PEZI|nr:hypothetical protein CMUS01_06522 [Colletotrichum musicola]